MTAYHLFLLFLTFYIGLLIATGLYFSKRQKTLADFWLAGKEAGGLSIGFSAAASWLPQEHCWLSSAFFCFRAWVLSGALLPLISWPF